ncbi:TPA: hypothetical protein EYO12_04170 [Candidatus Saccharibacteria bacterium]|nr:hypothetical protein [Candidatus Saccharibacteria bacterium]HIO87769.1 hypothetical protein [Candidatus Saccharibacteria bacterium]
MNKFEVLAQLGGENPTITSIDIAKVAVGEEICTIECSGGSKYTLVAGEAGKLIVRNDTEESEVYGNVFELNAGSEITITKDQQYSLEEKNTDREQFSLRNKGSLASITVNPEVITRVSGDKQLLPETQKKYTRTKKVSTGETLFVYPDEKLFDGALARLRTAKATASVSIESNNSSDEILAFTFLDEDNKPKSVPPVAFGADKDGQFVIDSAVSNRLWDKLGIAEGAKITLGSVNGQKILGVENTSPNNSIEIDFNSNNRRFVSKAAVSNQFSLT